MRMSALLLLAGCAQGSVLDDVDVVEATLEDVAIFFAGAIVGFEGGGANLAIVTAEGEALDVPVTLAGPRLGLMGGVSFGTSVVDLPLLFDGGVETAMGWEDPEPGSIPGSDLLGTYQGWQYSGQLIVGFRTASLFNEAGVGIPMVMLEFGGGASVEYTWVTITANQ